MTVAVARVTRTVRVIISIIAPQRIDLYDVCSDRRVALLSPSVVCVKIPWPDFVSPIRSLHPCLYRFLYPIAG